MRSHIETFKYGVLVFSFLLLMSDSSAANPGKQKKKKSDQQLGRGNESTSVITFDEDHEQENRQPATPVEHLFKNPLLNSGLASGADAINRSINSLMESLFYNLMDNEVKNSLTENLSVNIGLKRDVFQAENGAWVVVDKFGLGPQFGKELYRFNDIPVNLGASQSTDVFDIYLRTDPMRVNETQKLPFWRTAVNNWFGILPVLESILPPSFNANEMYDPLRRVETPFTFPGSEAAFQTMDIGTIKSFAISGGVNLGVELAEGIRGKKDELTSGQSAIGITIPYSVFRTGEYRISVLKRDHNTAWVGITDINRTGHKIETRLGRTYYLLSKTIPYWKGLATPVFPIDFSVEEAITDLFGRVYSFDLRQSEAVQAYLEAIHGNLAPAQISWLRAREDKLTTGVDFYYTKNEKRFETRSSVGPNIFIFNKGTTRAHSDAEIEITDKDGKFYLLEARQDLDRGAWDILTGGSSETTAAVANLRVRRVIELEENTGQEKSWYEFVAEPNPVDISFSLQILDKFVETEDLYYYLDSVSRFTAIKLTEELPSIPVRDESLQVMRRKKIMFSTDADSPSYLHVTPTHLGSFEATATVRILQSDFEEFASKPRESLWHAFCKAYKVDPQKCNEWQVSLLARNIDRVGRVISMPIGLLDIQLPRLDAVSEIENAVTALKEYSRATSPEDRRDRLRDFFNTSHPHELVAAIYEIISPEKLSRSVQLSASPKGHGPEEAKDLFKQLHGRRFNRGLRNIPISRYDRTKDVENKFNPAHLNFAGVKPKVRKLALFKNRPDDISNLYEALPEGIPPLAVRVYGAKLEDAKTISIYVRLEQIGKVQLAKFKILEEVIDIPVADAAFDFSAGTSNYLLRLSGPNGLVRSILASEALALGGDFKLSIAVSSNGLLWSDEKSLEFRLDSGRLLPLRP